jgi:hypothetical protein
MKRIIKTYIEDVKKYDRTLENIKKQYVRELNNTSLEYSSLRPGTIKNTIQKTKTVR